MTRWVWRREKSDKMLAKSCTKDRALKVRAQKKPDTDCARHCTVGHGKGTESGPWKGEGTKTEPQLFRTKERAGQPG